VTCVDAVVPSIGHEPRRRILKSEGFPIPGCLTGRADVVPLSIVVFWFLQLPSGLTWWVPYLATGVADGNPECRVPM